MPRASRATTTTPTGPRLVQPKAAPGRQTPSHDEIAVRAYERFLSEGAVHGRDLAHWFDAERELLETPAMKPARRTAASKATG
jgi:hypothetical protein